MQCKRNIVVLHYFYFRGEKLSEQWELEVQYLLKYKVGLNLLYPKIGEIRSVCHAAMDQSSEESPCSSSCCPSCHAAGKLPLPVLHGIFFPFFSNPPGVYKPPAVPSGAAQAAHYPAGTRGDIQAVTGTMFVTRFLIKYGFGKLGTT